MYTNTAYMYMNDVLWEMLPKIKQVQPYVLDAYVRYTAPINVFPYGVDYQGDIMFQKKRFLWRNKQNYPLIITKHPLYEPYQEKTWTVASMTES